MKIQVLLLLVVVTVGQPCKKAKKAPIPKVDAAKFKEEIIRAHKKVRNEAGATDMEDVTYDDKLAYYAQKWANGCTGVHGHYKNERKAMGGYVGQNIWMGGGTDTTGMGKSVSGAWPKEKKYYDIKTHKCEDKKKCGHYTQMVWSKTTKVGCGYKLCTRDNGKKWRFVVCDYAPGCVT